jgi:hypothetical protein
VVSRGNSSPVQLLKASLLAALTIAALGALGPAAASAETVVSCPFDPAGSANDINRGFYVSNYPGSNLDQVTLEYGGNASAIGSHTITLTARSGTYDGPIIGTRTASVSVSSAMATVPATYSFGGTPVAPGSTITFAETSSGAGYVFYNLGIGPCAGVTQTNGTTPPLDTPVNNHVGVTITQVAKVATPTGQRASALKKCKKKHSKKARKKCRKKARRLPV